VGIDAVKQGDLGCMEGATHRRQLAASGRVNAADFAKVKSIRWSHVPRRRPLIIGLGFSAGHKTKTVGSREYEPGAGFGAARAVALFRSLGDVNINLEANRAA
jgi:hypothetical protein